MRRFTTTDWDRMSALHHRCTVILHHGRYGNQDARHYARFALERVAAFRVHDIYARAHQVPGADESAAWCVGEAVALLWLANEALFCQRCKHHGHLAAFCHLDKPDERDSMAWRTA